MELNIACCNLVYCSAIQGQFPTKAIFKNFSLSQKNLPKVWGQYKKYLLFFVLATRVDFFPQFGRAMHYLHGNVYLHYTEDIENIPFLVFLY